MIERGIEAFGQVQQGLFEGAVQPFMFAVGLGHLLEDGFRATGWFLLGLLQIVVLLTVLRALERWRPVEAVTDHAAVRTDILYTAIHRLGLFRLGLFLTVEPLWNLLAAELRLAGATTVSVEALWPGVTDLPWVAFVVYLLVFDFVDYLIHRGQHASRAWWALHALHHSQRQMTMWSDSRNHLLDDLLRDALLVMVAFFIGVPPAQFVAVVVATQLLESLAHANLKLDFGRIGSRLLVSPRFHRQHHAIGEGHESAGPGSLGGCNFAVLFPVWDLLFRTARFDGGPAPTGIRDQLPAWGGRDYGQGFVAQQVLGVKRLASVLHSWRSRDADLGTGGLR